MWRGTCRGVGARPPRPPPLCLFWRGVSHSAPSASSPQLSSPKLTTTLTTCGCSRHSGLLDVGHFAVHEDNLHVLVHVGNLRAEVNDALGLPENRPDLKSCLAQRDRLREGYLRVQGHEGY